jgi:hypothetical protein
LISVLVLVVAVSASSCAATADSERRASCSLPLPEAECLVIRPAHFGAVIDADGMGANWAHVELEALDVGL